MYVVEYIVAAVTFPMCEYANMTLSLVANALGTLCSSLWPTSDFSQICGVQFPGSSHLLTIPLLVVGLGPLQISASGTSQKP